MTDKTLKIIKKLPADLQKEFETDFALHPKLVIMILLQS